MDSEWVIISSFLKVNSRFQYPIPTVINEEINNTEGVVESTISEHIEYLVKSKKVKLFQYILLIF